MAEEISRPLCATKKITMVSSGSSEVGAAKLAGEVLEIMTRLPSTVEKLTGISISLVRLRLCEVKMSDTGTSGQWLMCVLSPQAASKAI